MIFDTHCHLNNEELYPNIDQIIANAQKAGVTKFLVIGYDKKTSKLALDIAETYDFCYAAIGFHPTEIFELSENDYDEVMKLVDHPKVKAIGEIGLDYHWVKDPIQRELQKEYFIKQIDFANEHHLPISIHNRDAIEDCVAILEKNPPKYGAIMHCFSGSVEIMKRLEKLNIYFGFGGTVTFTNARTPKETAEECQLDRMVVETDCPYLTPHPYRGMTNEPKYISLVVEEIAKIKELSKKHIADITYKNACKLLNIDE